jgi:hypothetical protein
MANHLPNIRVVSGLSLLTVGALLLVGAIASLSIWQFCFATLLMVGGGLLYRRRAESAGSSVLTQELRMNWTLFFCISLPVFIAMWCRTYEGKMDGQPHWVYWRILFRHEYICTTREIVQHLIQETMFNAVPAFLAGWLGQFFIIIGWRQIRRLPKP